MDDEYSRDASDGSSPRPLIDFCSTAFTRKTLNHSEQTQKNGVLKRKVSKITGGGLREYSLRVCKKVESKRTTTYNEVADEIVAEFAAAQSNSLVSLNENDVKNIRRRVYDSLNVLLALDIIRKVRKEIQWKGLPSINPRDVEEIKVVHSKLISNIQRKAAYLKDLEDQIADLQNLMLRNRELHKFGSVPQGFSLPFILVQTKPQATVEIEISEDMRLVHFDFNSTPFSLHDDAYVLRLMHHFRHLENEKVSQSS